MHEFDQKVVDTLNEQYKTIMQITKESGRPKMCEGCVNRQLNGLVRDKVAESKFDREMERTLYRRKL